MEVTVILKEKEYACLLFLFPFLLAAMQKWSSHLGPQDEIRNLKMATKEDLSGLDPQHRKLLFQLWILCLDDM